LGSGYNGRYAVSNEKGVSLMKGIAVAVWKRGTHLQGQEISPGLDVLPWNSELLVYDEFEAEILSKEYASTPGLYEANLSDALRHALHNLRVRDAHGRR
jgi:hypothetical protein